MPALRIAALASGRGSNLAALLDACADGRIDGKFVLLASDKAKCAALTVAAEAGVPTLALRPGDYPDRRSFDHALFDALAASNADLLVLAGYMRIIDPSVLMPWAGRAVNVHPSLLPLYRGLHTHAQALAAGDAEHGASVHFVTAELDGGPVLAQARISIGPGDTEATLATRLLVHEHRLLPAVVGAIAAGRIAWNEGNPTFDGRAIDTPLTLCSDGSLGAAT
ncbi:phosphoribosylglycinamide formyltransferase [Pinirhizobacter soli]|uniref:phosphoribosylglycinamide formyltransferase n=1 Tax=Pinirhizobacter soli TaxID=2786953 RepID=UPI00202AB7C8|nr:phosphoribosylglycinamide formyltransferase [Pinirhizobacter soli]